MNPSNIPYHFGEHDSQHKSDQSTSTLIVYVTTSATSTGPVVGYTTLTSSKETTSSQSSTHSSTTSSTSSTSVSVSTTAIATATTSAAETSSLTQTTAIASTAEPITEYSTSSPVTEQTLVIDTTSAPSPISTSTMTSPEPSAMTSIVTSLKDLPSSIESPTSTVPKSLPLLVATSSSSATLATISAISTPTSQTSPVMFPKATDANRPIELPNSSQPVKSSSMTSTGKASLILGIVLLLGAILLMLQFYLKKKRDNGGSKILDDEKDGYRDMSQKDSVTSSSSTPIASPTSHPMSNNLPVNNQDARSSPASDYSENEKRSPTQTDTKSDPFGNHAEISVDSVNANGPNVLRSPSPASPARPANHSVPMLVRGASKRSQRQHDFPKAPSPISMNISNVNPTNAPRASLKSHAGSTAQIRNSDVPAAVHRAQLDFTPSMDDELELFAGQLVRVLHEYDDGWAMCVRLDSSQQGVCPRTCLSTRPMKPRSQSGSSGVPAPGARESPIVAGLAPKSPYSVDKGPLPATPNRQGVPNQPSSPEQWSHSVDSQRRPQEHSTLTLGQPTPCDMEPRGLNMTHATLQPSLSSEHGELQDPYPENSDSIDDSNPLPLKNMARYNCKVNTQAVGNFTAHTPDGCTVESPIIQQFSTNKPTPAVPCNYNSSDSRPSSRNSEIMDDTEPYSQAVRSRSASQSQQPIDDEYHQKPLPGQAL